MRETRPWDRLDDAPSWSDRTVEERARAIEAVCRTAMQILEATHDGKERLRRVDPVPPSTRALLRRLAAGRDG